MHISWQVRSGPKTASLEAAVVEEMEAEQLVDTRPRRWQSRVRGRLARIAASAVQFLTKEERVPSFGPHFFAQRGSLPPNAAGSPLAPAPGSGLGSGLGPQAKRESLISTVSSSAQSMGPAPALATPLPRRGSVSSMVAPPASAEMEHVVRALMELAGQRLQPDTSLVRRARAFPSLLAG